MLITDTLHDDLHFCIYLESNSRETPEILTRVKAVLANVAENWNVYVIPVLFPINHMVLEIFKPKWGNTPELLAVLCSLIFLYIILRIGWEYPGTSPSNEQDNRWVDNNGEKINFRGTSKYSERSIFQCHFGHNKPHINFLGIASGCLLWEVRQ